MSIVKNNHLFDRNHVRVESIFICCAHHKLLTLRTAKTKILPLLPWRLMCGLTYQQQPALLF